MNTTKCADDAGNEPKRQHYVPRSYLNRFINDSGKLHVYDKDQDKSFQSPSANVAIENHFYRLSDELLEKAGCKGLIDPNHLEKRFNLVENEFKSITDRILAKVQKGISGNDRAVLSVFILFQYMRTRSYRAIHAEAMTKREKTIAEDAISQELPGILEKVDINVTIDESHMLVHQLRALIDHDSIFEMSQILANHIWYLALSEDGKFITSDTPVVKQNHVSLQGRSFKGLGSPGIHICYPLSPNCAIVMKERVYFYGAEIHDGSIRQIDNQEVDMYNKLQVLQSFAQVYSSFDFSAVAASICKQCPDSTKKNRARVKVERAGDVIKTIHLE